MTITATKRGCDALRVVRPAGVLFKHQQKRLVRVVDQDGNQIAQEAVEGRCAVRVDIDCRVPAVERGEDFGSHYRAGIRSTFPRTAVVCFKPGAHLASWLSQS